MVLPGKLYVGRDVDASICLESQGCDGSQISSSRLVPFSWLVEKIVAGSLTGPVVKMLFVVKQRPLSLHGQMMFAKCVRAFVLFKTKSPKRNMVRILLH